jgi:hypothetical protein
VRGGKTTENKASGVRGGAFFAQKISGKKQILAVVFSFSKSVQ